MSPHRFANRPFVRWLVALSLIAPAMVHADDTLPPSDRFHVAAGHFRSDHNLRLRWDSSAGTYGTEIDFQRDLGFDRKQDTLPWNVHFAVGDERQHKFEAHGYGYSDRSRFVIQRALAIGDNVYPIDAEASSRFDLRTGSLSYTWFFQRDDRQATGIGIGALHYRLDIGIDALVRGSEGDIRLANTHAGEKWAPMLRAEYVRVLSPQWRWKTAAAYIRKPNGDTTGDIIDASVELEWLPLRNAGLALRYSYNRLDFDLDRSTFVGRVRMRQDGPQLLGIIRY
ncbi:MAG: hypothetical protein NVV60_04890 [Luteimonas sp.]|nr:hypothetical protein [Luteimonas sp.]